MVNEYCIWPSYNYFLFFLIFILILLTIICKIIGFGKHIRLQRILRIRKTFHHQKIMLVSAADTTVKTGATDDVFASLCVGVWEWGKESAREKDREELATQSVPWLPCITWCLTLLTTPNPRSIGWVPLLSLLQLSIVLVYNSPLLPSRFWLGLVFQTNCCSLWWLARVFKLR